MTPRFTAKVMVVTGAAQGIGKRVAELAAAEGARLVLVDIADYVQGVAAELRDQGAEALAVQANLETWEGAEMVMARAHEQYGRIDILINNVGGTIWAQPFEHYQPEQIQKEIQRSLFPTLWCCRAVLPYMVEQKGGAIVNVSSVATRGLMRVPYGAAKAGVNGMTVNLAFEYAEHNIRVNATAPGGTEAPPADPAQYRSAGRAGEGLVPDPDRPDQCQQLHAPLRHPGRTGRADPVPGVRCRQLHHRHHPSGSGRGLRVRQYRDRPLVCPLVNTTEDNNNTRSNRPMRNIDVNDVIDNASFNGFHWKVLFWCTLIIIFDGYDLVIYGVVLPLLMEQWNLNPYVAGLLGSSALFGMMFGAMGFGMLSDKWGRKKSF